MLKVPGFSRCFGPSVQISVTWTLVTEEAVPRRFEGNRLPSDAALRHRKREFYVSCFWNFCSVAPETSQQRGCGSLRIEKRLVSCYVMNIDVMLVVFMTHGHSLFDPNFWRSSMLFLASVWLIWKSFSVGPFAMLLYAPTDRTYYLSNSDLFNVHGSVHLNNVLVYNSN